MNKLILLLLILLVYQTVICQPLPRPSDIIFWSVSVMKWQTRFESACRSWAADFFFIQTLKSLNLLCHPFASVTLFHGDTIFVFWAFQTAVCCWFQHFRLKIISNIFGFFSDSVKISETLSSKNTRKSKRGCLRSIIHFNHRGSLQYPCETKKVLFMLFCNLGQSIFQVLSVSQ